MSLAVLQLLSIRIQLIFTYLNIEEKNIHTWILLKFKNNYRQNN